MIYPADEESACIANTTNDMDSNSFFKCLWNEEVEPTDEYVFFLINGSTTTALNCIVLVIAFLYVNTRSNPNQVFVIHMTTADLLVGFVVQLSRPLAPCFPSYFCGPYYVMAWMFQMGSVSNLLFLNLDKLLSIRIPLRYRVFVTHRRATSLAILCWATLFIISVLSYTVFLQFRDPLNPSCIRVKFDPEEYYAFLIIVGYVAPTIFSFAISIYIFIIVQAFSSRRSGRQQRRMRMQRVFFVFSSTMWTCITNLPYRIAFAFYTICTHQLHMQQVAATRMVAAAANGTLFIETPMTSTEMTSLTNLTKIVDNSPSYGFTPDACVGEVGLEAMTYMFKLLQVGTIGNPIITIITQRQYRCQLVAAWRSVAKSLHLPQWCYSLEHREIITDATSTRLNALNVASGVRNTAMNESSNCFANTTNNMDDDGFFKCLWNEEREPTNEYVFFMINGGTTVLLNCIVLVIAFLYVDTRSNPSQMFVIHMTAADLLVGFIVQLSRPFAPCFPSYFCGPYYVMAWMCQMGSVSHLLFLNLDKLLSIRIPAAYRVFVTRRLVASVVVLCWVALFIITVLSYTLFLQFRDPAHPSCVRVKFDPVEYYVFFIIIGYVAPIMLSFVISAYIFIIAQAFIRRRSDRLRSGIRLNRMRMQRIFFVFSSTMWTSITNFPYPISFAIYTFCAHRIHVEQVNSTRMAAAAANVTPLVGTQMTLTNVSAYANLTSFVDDTPSYGVRPDACVGEVGLKAMTYMFKLFQVSTIGNPIITIITQHQYRCRVVAAWRSVAKLLHLPQWCYPLEHRQIITEARLTPHNSLKVDAGI